MGDILQQSNSATPGITPSTNSAGNKFRILIADDEQDALNLLGAILEEFNYELLLAKDGEQALQLYQQFKPDMALLDLQMPGKTGLEVCKLIKEQNPQTFVPVLLITCQADPYVKLEGLKAGADDYVTKPYFCEELQIKIAAFLRIKKVFDDLAHQRDALLESEKSG